VIVVSRHEAVIDFYDVKGGPSWSFGVEDGMDDALGLVESKGVGGHSDLSSDLVLRHMDIQLGPASLYPFGQAAGFLKFRVGEEGFDGTPELTTVHQEFNGVDVFAGTEACAIGDRLVVQEHIVSDADHTGLVHDVQSGTCALNSLPGSGEAGANLHVVTEVGNLMRQQESEERPDDPLCGERVHLTLLIWASRRSMKRSSSPTQSLILSIILSRDLRCLPSL
jgi:hypothetical protein